MPLNMDRAIAQGKLSFKCIISFLFPAEGLILITLQLVNDMALEAHLQTDLLSPNDHCIAEAREKFPSSQRNKQVSPEIQTKVIYR